MPTSRAFGALTVTALDDAIGVFFQSRQEAFPEATAEHWRRADAQDAGAVRDGEWLLRFRCFAVRLDDGLTILVDAGIGAAEAPAKRWAPVPGRLPEELAAAGIPPGEVDVVVLTHMHSDHIGWAVDGQARTPYFGNARYLLQRTEITAIERLNPELAEWLLQPLRATGQLVAVDGETRLAAGLRVLATPGHTPGHQSVLLEAGGGTVLFTGDLLVHAVQLVDPGLPYAHETDPDMARTSRVGLLSELAEREDTILATSHLSEPFVLPRPHRS
jgi:glyoxylase-like metal-dependent hydrolase (beta-lactamase superfamily II)